MASRSFVLLVADQGGRSGGAATRLGITVSRRVGGAVVRARVRRRLREWFRKNRVVFPTGNDYVVIARPMAARITAQELGRELESMLARLHGSSPAT